MKLILSISIILMVAFIAFGQDTRDKGIELYQKGDYNAAISVLQNVIATNNKDRDVWLYLGMSFARIKKDKEALKALRKGDSISSKNSSGYDKELKIISKPRVPYTESARQNMTQGKVKLAIEFGADGKIKYIVPFQSLPDGLTQSCIAAAKNIEFDPAYKNSKPVPSIKVIEYSFDIY